MFRFFNKTVAIAATAGLLLTSCGGGKKPTDSKVEVRPQSTRIAGYLGNYLQVVDGAYGAEKDDHLIFSWVIKVKVRATAQYNDPDPGLAEGNYSPLHLDLSDDKGTPVTGFENLAGDYSDDSKLADILKAGDGETWVSFSKFHEGEAESYPDNVRTFSVYSEKVEKSESSSDASSGTSASDSTGAPDKTESADMVGDQDWDKLIADYKDYMGQYIKLLKKANEGDADALSEYPEIYEKAGEIATQIQAAKDKDISPEQMARFVKVEAEFVTEISKLK